MEEKIIEVLREINGDIVSYEGDNLFDAGILDSLQAINMVSELEDAFDIEIDAKYVTEENFKTMDAIISMLSGIIGQELLV